MSEWFKCSDELPDADINVLIFDGYDIQIGHLDTYEFDDSEWRNSGGYQVSPIYWMPLPEDPSDE